MPTVILQHSPTDGPGRLGDALRRLGHKMDIRRIDLHGPSALPTDTDEIDALIILGGPQNVSEDHPWIKPELDLIRAAHAQRLPIVGICLGHQLIAHALGGEVAPAATPEFGLVKVSQHPIANTDTILAGVPWITHQFQTHAQEVAKAPPDATVLQFSKDCKVQSFRCGLRTYGFQYHFEYSSQAIDSAIKGSFGQSVMAKLGLSAEQVRAQAAEHAETFARIADRLSGNIAAYMLPLLSTTKG